MLFNSAERARRLRPLLHGAGRYLPLLAAATAVGVFVAVTPSLPASVSSAAGSGIPSALGGSSGSSGAPNASAAGPSAPGATGSATGSAGTSGGATAVNYPAFSGTQTGKPDCSRTAIMNTMVIGGGTCRPPQWSGNNGGSSYHGVSGNQINIVIYRPQQNQAVATALQQAGQASAQQEQMAITAFQNWFNANYELYGRKLNFIFQVGPSANSTTDPSLQQADADYAVKTNNAFAVAALTGTDAFDQELARLGTPDIAFTSEQRLSEYVAESPYVTALLPDLDFALQSTAEYYCKKLNGNMAEYAGDPTYKTSPRKLGIIWVQQYTNAGPTLQSLLQQDCGLTVPNADTYEYSGNTNSLAQDATTAVDDMHQQGVTTVTCLCDPVSPIVFTEQSTNQGWMPEWFMNSIGLQDAPTVTRLYDQTQMAHAFGISLTALPQSSCDTPADKAYQQGSNGGNPTAAGVAVSTTFVLLAPIVAAIEATGPDLTATAFSRALFHFPATQGPAYQQHFSLGIGAHPYTMIQDLTQVYWSATTNGPDGKTGAWFYSDGGRRYVPGAWGRGEPAVFTNPAANGTPGAQDPCAG